MRTDLALFVELSILYRARFQNRLWSKYSRSDEDRIAAACLFLEGYAFERQGRDPAYAEAAVAAIEKAIAKDQTEQGCYIGQTVRNEFLNLLTTRKPNLKLNPLDHREERGCNCLWCAFYGENIIAIAKESLVNGEVKPFWERLQRIRGIGPKIASLFLRDVAVRYGLAPGTDRHLLQPIDVWVRRTVRCMAKRDMLTDEDVARWIVDNCEESELANQGIWYFGSQIAQSEFRLRRALENERYACAAVREHIATLEATVEAAKVLTGSRICVTAS